MHRNARVGVLRKSLFTLYNSALVQRGLKEENQSQLSGSQEIGPPLRRALSAIECALDAENSLEAGSQVCEAAWNLDVIPQRVSKRYGLDQLATLTEGLKEKMFRAATAIHPSCAQG
jgi:hydroxymethylpyrimidine pyrophosphatase-like HAD family hydrolase